MLDCLVIGGGQSGLACGYYLHKRGLDFRILDAEPAPGGAWQHTWDSLRLFSPATASNLPGMPMPAYPGYPPASHVVDYLRAYEKRYDLPVNRPVTVTRVDHRSASHEDSHGLGGKDYFVVALRGGDAPTVTARTVVAATGTWSSPFIPFYPGHFRGKQWHSAWYTGASPFASARVAVVGGANSGAQIAADLLGTAARVDWFTHRPPRWMPDDIDGRDLFHRSRARLLAQKGGRPDPGSESSLGDIVMVPPVKAARDAGRLAAQPIFGRLDELNHDHLIWCTGFRPALGPIRHLVAEGKAQVPGLFLVGYGSWTGPGSATITGVSPFAKQTAAAIEEIVRA